MGVGTRSRARRVGRAAGVLVAALSTALGIVALGAGSAQARTDWSELPWVVNYDGPHIIITSVTVGELAGRPGTHHTAYIDHDGSDDWFLALLYDWDCPEGQTPPFLPSVDDPEPCELLSSAVFSDGNGDYVRAWISDDIRRLHVWGTVPPEEPVEGITEVVADIRVRATGPRVVDLVERWQARNENDRRDAFRLKDVWAARETTTATGHVGWYDLTGPNTTTTSTRLLNLRHSWKGFGDGR